MESPKKLSVKFVKKKRIYLSLNNSIYPICWIEFLKDGSFSIGLISKKIKFTEYGSAIRQGNNFVDHLQTVQKGNLKINETTSPHYTFHPPRISQKSGIVHMVDPNGKVDEWNLNWFPVNKTKHLLNLMTGNLQALGTVQKPKKNFSIVNISNKLNGLRMEMFIVPVGEKLVFDNSAIDTIYGGCKYYHIVCNFYEDDTPYSCWYVVND